MNTSLVLSIIGEDHPGLVESLSDTIAGNGGNWLESRMAHMAGKFAGILRVGVASNDATALIEAIKKLESDGLSIHVETGNEEEISTSTRLRLEIIGSDQPGIIRDITRALAARGINVEELETETVSAPMSGEPLFKAAVELQAPLDLEVEELRAQLEDLAHDLMVEITLDSV